MTPAPTPQPPDHGAAGFCTDCGQAAPDERVETVARDGLVEVAYRAWCDARKGKPGAPGEYEALYSRIEAGWMAHVVAAVVAALDDETARLRAASRSVIGAVLRAGESDRAALDRVRALCGEAEAVAAVHQTPRDVDHRPCETFARARFAARVCAALDPEEPR